MKLSGRQWVLVGAFLCFTILFLVGVFRGLNFADLYPLGLALFVAGHL